MHKQNRRKYNKFKINIDGDAELYTEENKYLCKLDIEDVDDILWLGYFNKKDNGYIYCAKEKTYLHNYVMGITKINTDKEVDHINRDRLDNTIANLRIVNRQINNLNRGLNKNNSSGYKGVAYHKQRKKWRAYIMIDYKQKSLGLYKTKEEAYEVRRKAEKSILKDLIEEYNK